MTKLLILAYDFPPYVSVGGLRPDSWYKYLHLYGIHPVVITRQWTNRYGNHLDYIAPGYSDLTDRDADSNGTLIKTPFHPNPANKMLLKYGENKYRIFRKIISSFYLFAQYFLPVGNMREIYSAADEYLKTDKVDCIIATGDPFVLFKYASKLSEKYNVPWIADYRDAWVQDKTVKSRFYRSWSAFFEKRFLKNVSQITTVSTFIQKQIEQNIKDKNFEIVLNGFDPKIQEITKDVRQTNDGILSIAFAGTIYQWHPIESFLGVCNEIVEENHDIKLQIDFYGVNKADEIKELLGSRFKMLEKTVRFFPRMPNLELAEQLKKHDLFLLFNDYSILGTKIFDYLALGRKIILCYENDDEARELKRNFYNLVEMESESKNLQADVIKATKSGIIISDSKHLKTVILQLCEELKANEFIECKSVNTDVYSRKKQVERLAKLVKKIVKE